MGRVVKGGTTIVNPTVVQKIESGGEITININLTIKLEDGQISISTEDNSLKKEEKSNYIVPEIEILDVVEFGDKVI